MFMLLIARIKENLYQALLDKNHVFDILHAK